MRRKTYSHIARLSLAAMVFCLAGCSNASRKAAIENERKDIITAELTNNRQAGAGVFDIQSVELLTFKAQLIYSLNKSFVELPKAGKNNSQITTMYDGFGNKTEMRCLEDDPVLRCIILKTSVSGRKQAIVFGKNGETRHLPDDLANTAMTAEASYIAAAAGIFALTKTPETKPEPMLPENFKPFNEKILTTVPTPDMLVAEQKKKSIEETKPEEKPDSKQPENGKAQPPQIIVDSLKLNNYLPKKKKAPEQ